jgi:adenylyltransferase/sulfurtransferase
MIDIALPNPPMQLSIQEIEYYRRQLSLPDFDEAKQLKLKNAAVLVIGAGGLGCACLQSIASAGVGNIGIVDFDDIQVSNLHRQVLFRYDDVGKSKCEVAKEKLKIINPYIRIESYHQKINADNISYLLDKYDIVVDATDNFDTKYLINDACVLAGKPLVFGAVQQYEGQVAVFNYKNGANYRDIFPEKPLYQQNCNDAGVLNVAVQIIANFQASEVLKIILEAENILFNKILIYNIKNNQLKIINSPSPTHSPPIPQSGTSDDDKNRGKSGENEKNRGKLISNTIDNEKHIEKPAANTEAPLRGVGGLGLGLVLIDVRPKFEHKLGNKGGICIPIEILEQQLADFDKDKTLVFYCNYGIKSKQAVAIARKNGFLNSFYLMD